MYNEMVLKQGGGAGLQQIEALQNYQPTSQQWQIGNGLAPYGNEVRNLPTNQGQGPKRKGVQKIHTMALSNNIINVR